MSTVKQRIYELIYLIAQDASEDDVNRMGERISGIISDADGSIREEEDWGKRKLAYIIKKGVTKHTRAQYKRIVFQGPAGVTHEIERVLRINDQCIRFMHIRLDNYDPTTASRQSNETEEASV
jgi:small subunit ribosomal protein S6